MADYKKAFEKLIGVEGGYVNDPVDPGGETKFGISKRAYPHVDIKSLTMAEAMIIYKRDYWDALRLDDIAMQEIAEELFDSAVNMGLFVAGWLQEAYNLTNYWEGNHDLVEDGRIGPVTIKAVNTHRHQERMLKVLNILQGCRYLAIVKDSPQLEKYIGGWLNRVWEN